MRSPAKQCVMILRATAKVAPTARTIEAARRRQIRIFCLAFNKSVNNCKLLLQNGKAVSIILNWEKFGNLP